MIGTINIADYNYGLPEDRIAKFPLESRESSKLLLYRNGRITEQKFSELPELLEDGTLMVLNDTRVVQSRLKFRKETGSGIEVFCLEPYEPKDYYQAFRQTSTSVWKCLVGNAKKWRSGRLHLETSADGRRIRLKAEQTGREKDAFLIRFEWDPPALSFGTVLESAGSTPIPPYLRRQAVAADRETYQTVYSRQEGSVAAPTAGLHFTDNVLQRISERGIEQVSVTLHVGAGTFQPVIADDIHDHPMHAEHFYIGRDAIRKLLNHPGDILSVGTTSMRVLESVYWIGARQHQNTGKQLNQNTTHQLNPSAGNQPNHNTGKPVNPFFLDQWDAYGIAPCSKEAGLGSLLEYMEKEGLESAEGLTRLMIVPGYRFRITNKLLTNFHQPKSTLLLLVAALAGADWRKIYDFALNNGFRFLSYGDSSLLNP